MYRNSNRGKHDGCYITCSVNFVCHYWATYLMPTNLVDVLLDLHLNIELLFAQDQM